jgi:hypothetical protein
MTIRRWTLASWIVSALATIASLLLLAMGVGESTPGDTFVLGGAGGFAFALAALAFSTVGLLVTVRVPANHVAWVFSVIGLMIATGNLVYQYADQSLYGAGSTWPGAVFSAWLQNLLVPPTFGLVAVALMLFPDGHLPSRRWRLAAVPPLLGAAVVVIGYALRPGPLDSPFDTVVNPIGVAGSFDLWDTVSSVGWPLMGLGCVLAAFLMRARLKRATGAEHQQLKWVAFAATITGVMIGGDVVSFLTTADGTVANQLRIVALGIGFMALPIGAGVAILRYRLYDIDVVINRTLVYGALTAILAAVYLGSVLLMQLALEAFTAGSGLAVASSTLATAALVRPARARIQAAVDRRFYRRKYDAARTLTTFGTRLRDEIDLETLESDLRAVVAETMQPEHVTLWLRTKTIP